MEGKDKENPYLSMDLTKSKFPMANSAPPSRGRPLFKLNNELNSFFDSNQINIEKNKVAIVKSR
ncbi:hypothetical protein A3E46_03015 [Candidatus Woesebacteria bacterium RIFCSPHIGHO2_12_FULL_46_16]|uniref:Uncharacterized protein n=1 Tax=Candidatus Woesebacteria bacterium RIFCSPHIGHO2_12_FULL_46_16 TaxID=1802513 RepID=A0A1F8AZ43_9BACT|nr:MAG: hypothetical protein A3E46_03015 [Candidatus Woesebacteria bacterium RIFCSPHIGHO2_12_FULL_46_16]